MTPDPSAEIRDLARGVRAISCAFAFVLCYFNAALVFKASAFEQLFADMLGGKPLPLTTVFLFAWKPFFIGLALALPLCSLLVVCFVRPHRLALTIIGTVMLLAFFQMQFTWIALTAPLLSIVSGMHDVS